MHTRKLSWINVFDNCHKAIETLKPEHHEFRFREMNRLMKLKEENPKVGYEQLKELFKKDFKQP